MGMDIELKEIGGSNASEPNASEPNASEIDCFRNLIAETIGSLEAHRKTFREHPPIHWIGRSVSSSSIDKRMQQIGKIEEDIRTLGAKVDAELQRHGNGSIAEWRRVSMLFEEVSHECYSHLEVCSIWAIRDGDGGS